MIDIEYDMFPNNTKCISRIGNGRVLTDLVIKLHVADKVFDIPWIKDETKPVGFNQGAIEHNGIMRLHSLDLDELEHLLLLKDGRANYFNVVIRDNVFKITLKNCKMLSTNMGKLERDFAWLKTEFEVNENATKGKATAAQ